MKENFNGNSFIGIKIIVVLFAYLSQKESFNKWSNNG